MDIYLYTYTYIDTYDQLTTLHYVYICTYIYNTYTHIYSGVYSCAHNIAKSYTTILASIVLQPVSSLMQPLSTNLTSLRAAMSMLYLWSSLDIKEYLLSDLFELGLFSIVLILLVAMVVGRLLVRECMFIEPFYFERRSARMDIFLCWSTCFAREASKMFFGCIEVCQLIVRSSLPHRLSNVWLLSRVLSSLNSSIDRTQTDTVTQGQSGPGSNGIEGVPSIIPKLHQMLRSDIAPKTRLWQTL